MLRVHVCDACPMLAKGRAPLTAFNCVKLHLTLTHAVHGVDGCAAAHRAYTFLLLGVV